MTKPSGRRALFLDRDGVINIEKHHLYRIEEFEFIQGIFELCDLAQGMDFLIFVITNQAGIGRGYYTQADFERLTDWMLKQFSQRGIGITKVYHCPYHPTAGVGEYRRESSCRKPNPGMLLQAQEEFGLDLSSSVLVGDKESDIEAGMAAGVQYNLRLHESVQGAPRTTEFNSLQSICKWLKKQFTSYPIN